MPERLSQNQATPGAPSDQSDVVGFLANPASYRGVQRVDRFETHGNLVFVTDDEAYKIKRAVRFDYMDFSTLEKRRSACFREVELNRQWAPELYLGCVPITRDSNGALAFGGQGAVVEWAVRMRRFDQADLLSARAANDQLDTNLVIQLAYAVHASHQAADRAMCTSGVDVFKVLSRSISEALKNSRHFNTAETDQLDAGLARELSRAATVLDERAREGFVRRCHGDLHLANIVMWHGRPVLYDALEFDEALATIDTLYDLAFLLMDLEVRNLKTAANIILNRYLWRSGEKADLRGLVCLPLFLALRAAIRARVSIDRAEQEQSSARTKDLDIARFYFEAALRYLRPREPQLVVVGGLSGSGKTTVAADLAPLIGNPPGAVHLRSDLERKAMAGVAEFDRLDPASYTAEAHRRAYGVLHQKAKLILNAHHSVIIDAVYDHESDRHEAEALALALGRRFQGIWLRADAHVLLSRVAARHHDASDATPDVVRTQLNLQIGELSERWMPLDASRSTGQTLHAAKEALDVCVSGNETGANSGQSPDGIDEGQ